MTHVVNSGVTAKENNRNNTCNGAYKGSLDVGAATRGDDDIEKNLQKMIPDGWIGRFFRVHLGSLKPTPSAKLGRYFDAENNVSCIPSGNNL